MFRIVRPWSAFALAALAGALAAVALVMMLAHSGWTLSAAEIFCRHGWHRVIRHGVFVCVRNHH